MSPTNNKKTNRKPATPELDACALQEKLAQLANAASDAGAHELHRLSSLLVDLSMLSVTLSESGEDADFSDEMSNDCFQALSVVEESFSEYPDSNSKIQETLTTLEIRWGEYLDLLSDSERFSTQTDAAWEEEGQSNWNDGDVDHSDVELEKPFSPVDITDLLSNLQHLETPTVSTPAQKNESSTTSEIAALSVAVPPGLLQEKIEDDELISAYVDDAQRCLASMEVCLLELDAGKQTGEPLRQFCRELHTLKGASGTVGLSGMAEYLHNLENDVERMSDEGSADQTDALLECVDFIRLQIQEMHPQTASRNSEPVLDASPASAGTVSDGSTETYVRLEASRLDRLMDLLAELVMLRNRRETYVASLRHLHHEVNSCSTRLRLVDIYTSSLELDRDESSGKLTEDLLKIDLDRDRQLTTAMAEISKDVSELGRSLQSVFDPLSQDNSTISHLIGCFRSELVELRRQPIAGLLRRLHRVARDASKAEGRQVELRIVGQGTRAERALQEQLFEPLMHIIRNAVSHGIESPDERVQKGKPATGQVTLNASTDTNSLYLEIRDDGRGLNERLLEKRGRELGLIPPGSNPTKEQLWELILQSGFSTKSKVSQISGRGVGMDVVASQIRSMRGRITIDSVVGEYTSFHLEIPLRSTIEHAMIIRSGTQLFALPMHSVYGTQTDEHSDGQRDVVPLNQLFGMPGEPSTSQKVITLRNQNVTANSKNSPQNNKSMLSISVDAVVGVEEVVVRSLPPLLKSHECFSGVTLSGQAETVLVLDVPRLSEFAFKDLESKKGTAEEDSRSGNGSRPRNKQPKKRGFNSQSQRILVVDDSLSVRRSLVRKLQKHGFDTTEAADGVQALELLRQADFVGVTTDIDMPRMNGLEFIAEISRNEELADLPVVVLTGRRDATSENVSKSFNVRRVFSKPVSDLTVKAIVQALRHPVRA